MPDHDPDALLSIGLFSRASLLSVKSLRRYHEQGILVPASVDPDTGYRSYAAHQLVDAQTIHRLRALDLPLAAVREVVTRRDPEVTRKILADHHAQMAEQLERTERIVEALQLGVASPIDHTPVQVVTLDNTHALAVSGVVDAADFAAFLGDAYAQLFDVVQRGSFVPAGPTGALYEPEAHEEDEPVTAYVPITAPDRLPPAHGGVEFIELPTEQVARVYHHGDYDTIGSAYAALGAWVATHATASGSRVRELYEVSVPDTDDPSLYRTAVCWPILPDERTTP